MQTDLAHADLAATAHHIVTIQRKIDSLIKAKESAWRQILTATARGYRDGSVELPTLLDLMREMRESYGPGFGAIWNDEMPIKAASLRHDVARAQRNAPNGPDGSWVGLVNDIEGQPKPWAGISVVYVLFNSANDPCYVGSTANFPQRISSHRRSKPEAVRWTAYRCRDREHAYEVEDRVLREHKPAMNKRAGR